VIRVVARTAEVNGEEWGAEYSAPQTELNEPENSSEFRFRLWRIWDNTLPMAMVIGLNPSTADHLRNDPTVALCCNDARHWGCGGLCMMNIWAYRATEPAQMKRFYKMFCPVRKFGETGIINEDRLVKMALTCKPVVAAWSGHGDYLTQGEKIYNLLSRRRELLCYRRLSNGEAGHPLYLKRPITLQPYHR
jgi:hypothetical protein